MDISSPRQDSRHSQDSLSPSLVPQTHSHAQLATLLTEAYRDAESLRKELVQARKATEKAERVYQILNNAEVAGTSPPGATNGDSSHHKLQIKMIIEDYERRIARAEAARDEAEERRREAVEAVRMLDELLSALDREGRSYIRPILALDASSTSPSSTTRPMAPPSLLPARQLPRQNTSRLAPFSLPPHPSTHSPSASTSTRRPRTPSIDGLYSAAQPPNKKARPTDDSRGREPRVAYSESTSQYISNMTSQEYNNGRQILPQPQRTTAGADPKASGPRIINRDYRGMPSTSQRPNSHSRSESHSSASSMDVDEMILKATTGDEGAAAMAATASNGMPNGRHYPDSPQHQPAHLTIQQQQQQHLQQTQMSSRSSRRLIDRDTEDMHPGSGSPYPQQQASSSSSGYPANQNPVGQVRSNIGGSGGGGGQGSQSHVYTTHVFAPPMTGAPTKKSKFPNSAVPPLPLTTTTGSSPVPGSGPAIEGTHQQQQQLQQQHQQSQPQPTAIPPLVPFAATNEKGQRICRQCGIVGRYKDGKCVEKWGPGPCGPGTVCDRCRKKMKRVERRGTMESQQQQQQQHLAMQAQPQQHQPRPASHNQLPSSQGSDRSVQRSDTLLTTHASLGPSNFATSRSDLRDRDESGTHPAPSSSGSHAAQLRPSGTSSSHASGAQHAQNPITTVATSTIATRGGAGGGGTGSQRHQPTPPSITSLREQYDEDEDDEDDILLDKEQLPTSNIGRGGSVAAAAHSSRSSSRNGQHAVRSSGTNGTSSNLKRSTLGTASSRAPSDEVDADADADAEAEAEAEILGAVDAAAGSGEHDEDEEDEGDGEGDMEGDADADAELLEAVDAAEANSNGSSHGGERSWLKSES